jgi:hypothetical protein
MFSSPVSKEGGKDGMAVFRGDEAVALERRPRRIGSRGGKRVRIGNLADAAGQNGDANGNGGGPLQSTNPL